MRKSLLFLSFLVANIFYSQQVTIGSGTRVDGNVGLSTPISIYYGYSLSQQIYLASEIGPAMNISKLKFNVSNNITSLDNTGQVDVWIGHTDATGFQNVVGPTGAGWIPVAQQQKVLTSGSLTFSGTEITVTLDTPFAYNGTQNLVITFDENTPGHNGSSYPFYQTADYTEDVSLINRSDNENPDPLNPIANYTGPNSTNTTEVQGKKYKAIVTMVSGNLAVAESRTVGDAIISPNPSSDFIIIKTKLSIGSVEIFDLSGKKMNAVLVNDKIDIRNLNAGVYMLKINYKEGFNSVKKITKK